MMNLSERSTLPEKMDDPNTPEKALIRNLSELETINKLLGGYGVILNVLNKLTATDKPIGILDIGCGGGDTLRATYRWAKRKNRKITLTGIDYNPVMIKYGNTHSLGLPIAYKQMDVYDDAVLDEEPDVVMCSLFLHHFKHQDVVRIVKRMYDITTGNVIINDLHRHWLAYYSIKVLTRLFSRSYMVRHDAPISVARAFKRDDWESIMAEAGISDYTIKWRWAWRWEVVINKMPQA